MPLEVIQAIATGLALGASGFYYRKMRAAKTEFNGHPEEMIRIRREFIRHSTRMTELEEDLKDLRGRLKTLESREA